MYSWAAKLQKLLEEGHDIVQHSRDKKLKYIFHFLKPGHFNYDIIPKPAQ